MDKWIASGLRVTVFPITSKSIDDFLGWQQILGIPPDETKRQPKLNLLEETGEFEKGLLTYKVLPGRADWTYQPLLISGDKLPENMPSLGSFTEAVDAFLPIASKWLEQCKSISRLAFGATAFMPTDSHEAAYKLLGELLKSVKVDPQSSELFYQINRKRPSKSHPGAISINRLSKWRPLKIVMGLNEVKLHETFACSLELDINNVPIEKMEIGKEQIRDLLNEFISLGVEIMSEGDIP